MKTISEVRRAFWSECGFNWVVESRIKHKRPGKDWRCDVRCAFVDYVDMLQKSGFISEALAQRVTL